MMIHPKACFSKHSQWPPKLVSQNIRSGRLSAFAFARLESICCFYPWMSESYSLSCFNLAMHDSFLL
ncbi:hypothetical protein BC332_25589 [Capsicum chinense]|nr:hypothetical protein BC332_25589 [Capsicum chinense]